ncbi:MAG TPA: phosphopyruvate hydratase [Chlamydiales bacterium]|nr:phosphopyruvate hydratase [Chlamydiales bacterium]
MVIISKVQAYEILDSRGNPTIAAEVFTSDRSHGKAFVPSGASTGIHEAVELRDRDPKRYGGKGVLHAVANVNGPIQELLLGKEVTNQRTIDELMITADGTPNKSHFGANAILAVSLATARAAAHSKKMPLYAYLGTEFLLPIPMLNVINGGVHADSGLAFQEFMIRPHGFSSFHEMLRAGVEVFHTLKTLLKKEGFSTSVGDEGGFAPKMTSHEAALEIITKAIEKTGYKIGSEITLALDCAASEFYDAEKKHYLGKTRAEYIDYLVELTQKFAIDTIEDGLGQEDWEGWKELSKKLPHIQLVGDDIFATNPKLIARGIKEKIGNAVLIKVNQIGTLTETLNAIQMAKKAGYKTIISHRSGETEDSFIADLAVATGAGQIKTGAPCRSERVAKYNRLLEIENLEGVAKID